VAGRFLLSVAPREERPRGHPLWHASLGVDLRRCLDGAAGTGVSPGRAGKGRHAVGVPLPGRRARLQARAARRLRLGAGGGGGARAGARAAATRAGVGGVADAGRVRRRVSRPARGRAGDDREASLAAPKGGAQLGRAAPQRASLAGDRGLADDDPAWGPLRGNPGAPAGARARGQLGAAGCQRGQAWGREPATALHGEAAVRLLGRAPRAQR
jgi:hypothetical protein